MKNFDRCNGSLVVVTPDHVDNDLAFVHVVCPRCLSGFYTTARDGGAATVPEHHTEVV